MPTTRHYDVFISYSHKDRELVQPLVQLLTVNSRRVFWDAHSLSPGQVWPVEIESAIVGCKRFVLLWCCDTADSDYVSKELALAVQRQKVIIPVLLCPLPPPESITDRQWIDLRGKLNHACQLNGELAERHRKGVPVSSASPKDTPANVVSTAVGAAVGAFIGVAAAPVGVVVGGLAGSIAGAVVDSRRRSRERELEGLIRGYFETIRDR